MNARAGRSTGEGGGALGLGKPPWGGKGGPILSQDLNRHDGSWSRRHGRCRPASLHHFPIAFRGGAHWGGPRPFGMPGGAGLGALRRPRSLSCRARHAPCVLALLGPAPPGTPGFGTERGVYCFGGCLTAKRCVFVT